MRGFTGWVLHGTHVCSGRVFSVRGDFLFETDPKHLEPSVGGRTFVACLCPLAEAGSKISDRILISRNNHCSPALPPDGFRDSSDTHRTHLGRNGQMCSKPDLLHGAYDPEMKGYMIAD